MILLLLFLFGTELVVEKEIQDSVGQFLYVFSFHSEKKQFTRTHQEILSEAGYDISFLMETEMKVSSIRDTKVMQIIATNENFLYLSGKKLISGGWFNKQQVDRRRKVAVISKKAAFQFFGTTKAVSNEIEIAGVIYEIIGVMEQNEGADIYIPIGNMKAYYNYNEKYSQLWCNLQNEADTSLFLQRLGISDSDVSIFQSGEYQKIINLRIKSIVFMIGAWIIVLLLKNMYRNAQKIGCSVREFLQMNYVTEFRKLIKQKNVIKNILGFGISGVSIILIYKMIRFELLWPGKEELETGHGILLSIAQVLKFYMQPHLRISIYDELNLWNVLSIILCFLILLAGSIFVYAVGTARRRKTTDACHSEDTE